jgi:phosphoribosylglycinamide formyltransferase-1
MEQQVKIILFARDGILSNSTLEYLLKRFDVMHVLIERRDKKKEVRTYINTQGLFRFTLFILRSFLKKVFTTKKDISISAEEICARFNTPFSIVASHNGKKSLEYLEKSKPDLAVLCAARIISKKVIDKFRIGILNCHPGWLPDYRGWDALRWSVFYNNNIGVTVHFIDNGVDMGDIVVRQQLETSNFSNFAALYQEALKVRLELLEAAVAKILDNSYIRIPQKPEEGKRYYRMGLIKMAMVNFKLRKGLPKAHDA